MKTRSRLVLVLVSILFLNSNSLHGAGVTVLTHGYASGTDNWISEMADAVAVRFGGLDKAAQYTMTIGNGLGGGEPEIESFTRDSGSPMISSLADYEIILKVCWGDLDAGVCPDIEPTWNIAPLVSWALQSSTATTDASLTMPLAELPLHLIGHSRGASLLAEVCRLLGTNGVWVDHFTMLDPHPINGPICPHDDAPMGVSTNVLFADNYWREGGVATPNGEFVTGATNRYLMEVENDSPVDFGYGSEHSDVHLWYHGTIDLGTPVTYVDDGDSITINEEMRADWWTAAEDRGAKTGYRFSRIGGGTMTGGTRPSHGVRSAGASRESTVVTANGPDVWDNVAIDNFNSDYSIAQGLTLYFAVAFEDRDRDATVTVGFDSDANPYNGIAGLPSRNYVTSSLATDFFVAELSTAALQFGRYHLYARITNGLHARYYYARGAVIVGPSTVVDGLVASYPFDGNAYDVSGNGNHGIISNVVSTFDRFGAPNRAYYFNGQSAHIDVADAPTLDISNAVTVTAWVNFEQGGSANPRIVHKHVYQIYTIGTGPMRRIAFTCPPGAYVESPASVAAGKWLFVAGTYDRSSIRLYLDGTLVSANPATTPIGLNDWKVRLGRNTDNSDDLFQGAIDDVRIYNRALRPSEIRYLYSPNFAAGLAAYYPLNSGPNDESGNNQHGMAIGNPLPVIGVIGNGLYFDGVDDRISLPANFLGNGLPQGTLTCWARLDSVDIRYGRVIFNRGTAANHTSLLFAIGDTRRLGVNINNQTAPASLAQIQLGQLSHLAVSWNGSRLKYFIDGNPSGDFAFSATVPPEGMSRTVDIGRDDQNVGYFHGLIDEFRIYDRVLSPSEILSLTTFQQPMFTSTRIDQSGSLVSTLTGAPGRSHRIEIASNLTGANWMALGVVTGTGAFTNLNASAAAQRFYRATAVTFFVNGSFEEPHVPRDSYLIAPTGSSSLPGWSIGGSGGPVAVAYNLGGFPAANGDQDLAFNSGDSPTGTWIAQTFTTEVGRMYDVSFSVGRTGGGGGTVSLRASVKSSNGDSVSSVTATPPAQGYGGVQHLIFTATSTATTLEFLDTSTATTSVDVMLDNVVVRALDP